MKLAFGVTYLIAAIRLIVAIVVAGRQWQSCRKVPTLESVRQVAVVSDTAPWRWEAEVGLPQIANFHRISRHVRLLRTKITNLLDVLNSLELQ